MEGSAAPPRSSEPGCVASQARCSWMSGMTWAQAWVAAPMQAAEAAAAAAAEAGKLVKAELEEAREAFADKDGSSTQAQGLYDCVGA